MTSVLRFGLGLGLLLLAQGVSAQDQRGLQQGGMTPTEALAAVERFCVSTKAEASALQPLLDALDVGPMDKVVENNGDEIHMNLRISPDATLDVVFEQAGRVLRCNMQLELADVPQTASVFGQQFGVPKSWQDHPVGANSTTFTLLNGVVASFGYAKDPARAHGTLSVYVTPKAAPMPD